MILLNSSVDDMTRISRENYFDIIDESHRIYVKEKLNKILIRGEDREGRNAVIDIIEPYMRDKEVVLDVGVGPGVNSLFFLINGDITELIGLDNDFRILEMLKQNAETLGVNDRVKIVTCDLVYGMDSVSPADCVLCMDILYGNNESAFGKNASGRDPNMDDFITLQMLLEEGIVKDKIIITRKCLDTSGYCENPNIMNRDLREIGYNVIDFGCRVYDVFAIDYAIAER